MVIDLQQHTTSAPGVTAQTESMRYVAVLDEGALSEVAGTTSSGESVLTEGEALSTQDRADRFRSQMQPIDPGRFVE
jgi:hypothetical protein